MMLPALDHPAVSPRDSPSSQRYCLASAREPSVDRAFYPHQPPASLSPRRMREASVSPTSTEIKVSRFYSGRWTPDPESRPGKVAQHMPAGREEVRTMASQLHEALNAGDCAHADEVWSNVFCELVRQVRVHTVDRGELLEAVRAHYEGKIKVLRDQVRKQEVTVKKLQSDMSILFGESKDQSYEELEHVPADAAALKPHSEQGRAGDEGKAEQQRDARVPHGEPASAAEASELATTSRHRPAEEELAARAERRRKKRAQMILDAARPMRPSDRAQIGLALMKDPREDGADVGSEEVIRQLLTSVPPARRGELLANELLRLPSSDAVAAWAMIADRSSDHARSGIFGVVGRLMAEDEREAQLIHMMSVSSPASRANIASGMLAHLPLAERQNAIVTTLGRLPRHEKVYILRDAFNELNIAESVDVVAGKASDMEKDQRESYYCKHIDQLSGPERAVVIEQQLVGLPTDTRGRLIASVAGMCTGPERKKIWLTLGGEEFGNTLNMKRADSELNILDADTS